MYQCSFVFIESFAPFRGQENTVNTILSLEALYLFSGMHEPESAHNIVFFCLRTSF